jgi:hypothetical protein
MSVAMSPVAEGLKGKAQLAFEALGFQADADRVSGILFTPWRMNLVTLSSEDKLISRCELLCDS